MSTIHGIWKDGHFDPTGPVDLPERTRVSIHPLEDDGGIEDPSLTTDDPESIARWMAYIDSLEPLESTPEEEAELKRLREEAKERDKAGSNARADRLRDIFE